MIPYQGVDSACPEHGIFLHALERKDLGETIDLGELLPMEPLLSDEDLLKEGDAGHTARDPDADNSLNSTHAALQSLNGDGTSAPRILHEDRASGRSYLHLAWDRSGHIEAVVGAAWIPRIAVAPRDYPCCSLWNKAIKHVQAL